MTDCAKMFKVVARKRFLCENEMLTDFVTLGEIWTLSEIECILAY